MIRVALIGLLASFALPAAAQDYYATTSTARHGNGYAPSSMISGWEGDESFAVIAIVPDGQRIEGGKPVTDWKAVVTTGPRAEPEDEEEEDERYEDRDATDPKPVVRRGPPVPRTEITYSSRTCPAIMARAEALKPLASFEFDPPLFKGNSDGGVGDGREGFDLWMRVGDAELIKSAETPNSALGRWFNETRQAIAACTPR